MQLGGHYHKLLAHHTLAGDLFCSCCLNSCYPTSTWYTWYRWLQVNLNPEEGTTYLVSSVVVKQCCAENLNLVSQHWALDSVHQGQQSLLMHYAGGTTYPTGDYTGTAWTTVPRVQTYSPSAPFLAESIRCSMPCLVRPCS